MFEIIRHIQRLQLLFIVCTFAVCYGQFLPKSEKLKRSAIRLRIGDGIFRQTSRLAGESFERQIGNAIIEQQQQCFAEGCIQLYDFQISSYRVPSISSLSPKSPNLLSLTFTDFDLHISGSLSGLLQLFPPLPVVVPTRGQIAISAVQLSLIVQLDIQKTVTGVPYMRIVSCELESGFVAARLHNVGLITEFANLKYQDEIGLKSRELTERTLCSNTKTIIDDELNRLLAKLPIQLPFTELIEKFFHISETNQLKNRVNSERNLEYENLNFTNISRNNSKFSSESLFNIEKLKTIVLSLELLDSSASYENFFVGIDGDVNIANREYISNPYSRPIRLRFTNISNDRMMDLLISEYTINTALLRAHSIGAGVFYIGSKVPILGKLLRTTCSLDEVCLSDSVPEPGEKYPNKQLELIIRTTSSPNVRLANGTFSIHIEGRVLFFLEGTTTKVGMIPFDSVLSFELFTFNDRVHGSLLTISLNFKDDVDFFGLSVQSLNSLKDSTKGALLNFINQQLKAGLPLQIQPDSYLSRPYVAIRNESILLKADINIEKLFNEER